MPYDFNIDFLDDIIKKNRGGPGNRRGRGRGGNNIQRRGGNNQRGNRGGRIGKNNNNNYRGGGNFRRGGGGRNSFGQRNNNRVNKYETQNKIFLRLIDLVFQFSSTTRQRKINSRF